MTVQSILALFAAMLVLAIIPGPAVFAVVSRSMASGFTHGLFISLGIVAGDFVFILLAIYGLSAMAETMGSLFIIVKYAAGAYLIWLGISLWRAKPQSVDIEAVNEASWLANFLTGLFITLGNPKAILFYIGFFPAFLELSSISTQDIFTIMAVTVVAIGGVNLAYSYMAHKARILMQSQVAKRRLNITAGSVMIATGSFLIAKN